MKPTWVYGLGRCGSCRSLHVVRTRHPDNPAPQPPMRHGAVGIGQQQIVTQRRREPAPKSDADVAAVIREAFPRSERGRLRALAEAA